ncbi:hypothetical protein GEMRC1_004014 [Eukaryota sp. GEM-RC1]
MSKSEFSIVTGPTSIFVMTTSDGSILSLQTDLTKSPITLTIPGHISIDELHHLVTSSLTMTNTAFKIPDHYAIYVQTLTNQRIWIDHDNIDLVYFSPILYFYSHICNIQITIGSSSKSFSLQIDDKQPVSHITTLIARDLDIDHSAPLAEFSLHSSLPNDLIGPILNPTLTLGSQHVPFSSNLYLVRTAYVNSFAKLTPNLISLHFHDFSSSVINGCMKLTQGQAVELATLSITATLGSSSPKSLKPQMAAQHLPANFAADSSILNRVVSNYKTSKGQINLDIETAMLAYLQLVEALPCFGISSFAVKHNGKRQVIHISRLGILLTSGREEVNKYSFSKGPGREFHRIEDVVGVAYDDRILLVDFRDCDLILTCHSQSKMIGEVLLRYTRLLDTCHGVYLIHDVSAALGIISLKKEIDAQKKRLEKRISNLLLSSSGVSESIRKLCTNYSRDIADLQFKCVQSAGVVSSLQGELHSLQEKLKGLDEMNTRVNELEMLDKEKTNQIVELSSTNQELVATNQEQLKQIDELELRVVELAKTSRGPADLSVIRRGFVRSVAKPYFEKQSSHHNSLKEVVTVKRMLTKIVGSLALKMKKVLLAIIK